MTVSPHAQRQDETLGTKFKFWYFDEHEQKILFKRGRDNEDWSEKIAAELAKRLALPAADVELAELEGSRGIVSPSFLEPGSQLHHGNELLMGLSQNYPTEERYHVGQHTLEAILKALEATAATPGASCGPGGWSAADQMIGYLLLDALIGNTDRHHENWAIYAKEGRYYLAPTYDHASSLGRNEPAHRIDIRLEQKDPRVTVETYAAKARSAIYADVAAKKPLTTLAVFEAAATARPAAARHWFTHLAALDPAEVQNLFERVPDDRISARHRTFAVRLIATNTHRLGAIVAGLAH